eukprot:4255474-Pyramimonas_sp.AAC.1
MRILARSAGAARMIMSAVKTVICLLGGSGVLEVRRRLLEAGRPASYPECRRSHGIHVGSGGRVASWEGLGRSLGARRLRLKRLRQNLL